MAEPQTTPSSPTPPPSAARSSESASRPSGGGGPGARLRSAWRRLSPWPGGKWVFSRLIDWMAPYTGSIRARVEELSAGHCRVSLTERRALRNPFNSVHAVALLNLAEEASGLATLYALPPTTRGIITGLSMDYRKKARGRITAECRTLPPTDPLVEPLPHVAEVILTDASGEVVATAKATWTLSPTA